ncbi:MAG: hypothetical protein WBQ95_04390 [Terracidiphilus sp.]
MPIVANARKWEWHRQVIRLKRGSLPARKGMLADAMLCSFEERALCFQMFDQDANDFRGWPSPTEVINPVVTYVTLSHPTMSV